MGLIVTILDLMRIKVLFLIAGIIYVAAAVLSFFSAPIYYLLFPVIPITSDWIALTAFILSFFGLFMLFLIFFKVSLAYEQTQERMKSYLLLIALIIFPGIQIVLESIFVFVGTAIIVIFVISIFGMSVFYIDKVLRAQKVGYFNPGLMAYSLLYINNMIFYALLLSGMATMKIQRINAAMSLLVFQGFLQFGCFAAIGLKFLIDALRREQTLGVHPILSRKEKKKQDKFEVKAKKVTSLPKSDYNVYIKKAHEDDDSGLSFCKNCGAINTDMDEICFSCKVPLD